MPELEQVLGHPRGGGGGRWGWTLPAAPGRPSPSPPAWRKSCCDLSRLSAWCHQQKLTRDPSDSSNQTSWRKANLTCKIAIDNLEKAELLQGGDLLRQRKTTKESLAQTSSTITESLMGISRMMAQQVQQSEEAMQTLGKAGPGAGSWARGRRPLTL